MNGVRKRKVIPIEPITFEMLKDAKKAFESREPRDLFYRVAVELVELSMTNKTSFSIAESLSVLLQTWNREYYRYRGGFSENHFKSLERVIESNMMYIIKYRNKCITDYSDDEEEEIKSLFRNFENVVGIVGAAKSLHLLAPGFFPIWDDKIAYNYNIRLKKVGLNNANYIEFIKIVRNQYNDLVNLTGKKDNLLKSIDEYNYCHFSKKWI